MAFRRRVGSIDTLVLVRRECAAELPKGGESFEPRMQMRAATREDAAIWHEAWREKLDWYLERLDDPRQRCVVGVVDGRLVVHCWFCLGAYRDPVLHHTFDPGEGGVYQGEGWVHPDWRGQDVATAFIRLLYADFLPKLGVRHVVAYYEVGNVASERLHARFRFHETGRLLHLRLFGRHLFLRRPTRAAREARA